VRVLARRNDWIPKFILNLIAQHPYGLSGWEIKKIMRVPYDVVKYHLKKLVKMGYIEKAGRKYIFPYRYKIVDGVIIVRHTNGFSIFSCPYFKNKCKCKSEDKQNCRYLKELPDFLMNLLKK